MDGQKAERFLAFLYFTSAILSVIELVTILTPWIHWSEILDTCPNYRCGCILYGFSGFNFFNGGKNIICRFATFASIPVILLATGFAIYHGYRTCIVYTRRKRTRKTTYRRGRSQEQEERGPSVKKSRWWILWVTLTILVAILLLANAVTVSVGYYKSCNEYRKTLVKVLVATGNSAKVIYDRLQCGAVFDFMDYMEPFTRPFYIKDESRHRPTDPQRDFYRGNMINTGISLQITIVCLWFNFFIWAAATVYHFMMAKIKCCSCYRDG